MYVSQASIHGSFWFAARPQTVLHISADSFGQTIADCFYALSEINLVSGKYQEAQLDPIMVMDGDVSSRYFSEREMQTVQNIFEWHNTTSGWKFKFSDFLITWAREPHQTQASSSLISRDMYFP